ncbi:PIN domain-containing protein [Rufibacter immobilis]|uniref:PIN domain-containing protein n=1 Tax=Rufibacter immobilis TaxID=1348778 RepID=UPI0035E95D87
MINLIIDTNIWIYLAQGEHPYILEKVLEKVENREFRFIVSELQIHEWNRHKDKIKEDIVKSLRFQYNSAKSISTYISSTEKSQYLKIIEKELKDESQLLKIAEDKYNLIEDILKNKSIVAPVTDKQKLEVSDWAIEGKAPFHKKSNSYADALILLSGVEYVKEHSLHKSTNDSSPVIPDSVFISYNHTDFSKGDKMPDKDIIHPDLEPLLGSVKMSYIRHIDRLVPISAAMQVEINQYWEYIDDMVASHFENQYDIMRGR